MLFRIADDNGLLLLDLKDLRAMARYVGENASAFTQQYGNVSSASVGAIQRNLLTLEEQGGDKFFGEPAMNLDDFLQTAGDGRGMINVLYAERLLQILDAALRGRDQHLQQTDPDRMGEGPEELGLELLQLSGCCRHEVGLRLPVPWSSDREHCGCRGRASARQ